MKNLKLGPTLKISKALFPIAIATCFLLVISSLVLSRASNSEIAASILAEQRDVRTALSAVGDTLLDQSRAYAAHLTPQTVLARENETGPIVIASPVGNAYIVDLKKDFERGGATDSQTRQQKLLASMAPSAAQITDMGKTQLRGSIGDKPDDAIWGAGVWRTMALQGSVHLVALTPYHSLDQRPHNLALLVERMIDPQMLANIARSANTARIEIVDNKPLSVDATSIKLNDAGLASGWALVWAPKKSGNELAVRMSAMLLVFMTIFATFVVIHMRRVTGELIKNEANAKVIAVQDALTGLPNRYMFGRLLDSEMERIHRSVNDHGLAVHFIDIDRFKEVNDTFGHEIGDLLIIAFTQRISNILRSSGRLVRLGGDGFAILQTDVVGPRDAEILARRVLEAMKLPFEIGSQKLFISLSTGIALSPHDATDVDELIRRADLALYRAKNEGRNRYCFFEQRIGEQLQLRKVVEDDLRMAIETGSLLVLYQPVMAIDGKKMLGVEALVRWPHPIHGLISPANFITLAEECGLILPLGEWVLRRALHDVRRWPGLRVAVNVSAIQFRTKEFVPMVERLLAETGVNPSQLELELTESVLLADADSAENSMIDLRAMGVRLALDDFGTGYSSLIYLRRFAFDKIKIDRSFLESMEATGESAIIVHSIVHLGRALDLTVTAEGIETIEQQRFLQALGCHELQGYLFARPIPASDIDVWLLKQIAAENNPVEMVKAVA